MAEIKLENVKKKYIEIGRKTGTINPRKNKKIKI